MERELVTMGYRDKRFKEFESRQDYKMAVKISAVIDHIDSRLEPFEEMRKDFLTSITPQRLRLPPYQIYQRISSK